MQAGWPHQRGERGCQNAGDMDDDVRDVRRRQRRVVLVKEVDKASLLTWRPRHRNIASRRRG